MNFYVLIRTYRTFHTFKTNHREISIPSKANTERFLNRTKNTAAETNLRSFPVVKTNNKKPLKKFCRFFWSLELELRLTK